MNKGEKLQMVASLGERFSAITNAFLIDYRGLKVVDATVLRRKIRECNGSYIVVKNSLALRAAKSTKLELLAEHFDGPTAIAYHQDDIVGLAKLLTDVKKTNPSISFKAALVEGKVVQTSEIPSIAALPSREVMMANLMLVLRAPLQKLATVLKAPLRDLALVLKQIPK